MTTVLDRLSDIVRRRGVRRLAYLHCDHFEPWRNTLGSLSEANAEHVVRFAEATAAIDFARRLTLFYRPHVSPTMTHRRNAVFVEGDELGFVRPDAQRNAIGRAGIGRLVATSEHEIQLHIHHEHVTRNDRHCFKSRWGEDFFLNRTTPQADSRRFELLVDLSLAAARAETGLALDRWFFVHGNWGLNGGDPDVCHIADEIEILRRHGCVGDFTFPAEAPYGTANPSYETPMVVRPLSLIRCYDRPEGDPRPAFGAGEDPARFFVWAAPRDFPSSLDYFAEPVARRCADPEAWAETMLTLAPVLGDTLFVKTYAHSMNLAYTVDGETVFPHQHPPIRWLFGTMFEAATAAGASLAFLTASEVHDAVLRGDGAP